MRFLGRFCYLVGIQGTGVQLEFLKSILSDGGRRCGDRKKIGFSVDGHLNKVRGAKTFTAGGCFGVGQSVVKVSPK